MNFFALPSLSLTAALLAGTGHGISASRIRRRLVAAGGGKEGEGGGGGIHATCRKICLTYLDLYLDRLSITFR